MSSVKVTVLTLCIVSLSALPGQKRGRRTALGALMVRKGEELSLEVTESESESVDNSRIVDIVAASIRQCYFTSDHHPQSFLIFFPALGAFSVL